MKKGDIVTINDGSYPMSVIDGKMTYELLDYGDAQDEQYKIIEIGCVLPAGGFQARECLGIPGSFNDTVIQAIDSGKVVFVEERFLELVPPTHKVMIDMIQKGCCLYGDTIKISDKLYQEIKRDSRPK